TWQPRARWARAWSRWQPAATRSRSCAPAAPTRPTPRFRTGWPGWGGPESRSYPDLLSRLDAPGPVHPCEHNTHSKRILGVAEIDDFSARPVLPPPAVWAAVSHVEPCAARARVQCGATGRLLGAVGLESCCQGAGALRRLLDGDRCVCRLGLPTLRKPQ